MQWPIDLINDLNSGLILSEWLIAATAQLKTQYYACVILHKYTYTQIYYFYIYDLKFVH